ncbi:hypothetical protein like AT1G62350 [Hibiscus trionum]|uniref:Uncharacterized protein n=1 Tax=Hibiscus trionum TaxID=183268 RepID=A0A9W7J598_HIBTR|nr:hypothetical protein like AT1G62350 [Hibiscus trionum]
MTKEGLMAAKELKRLQQNQISLYMKLYDVVRKEIWYRPDMFFYGDMLMMLARNRTVDESRWVWDELKRGKDLFGDQESRGNSECK